MKKENGCEQITNRKAVVKKLSKQKGQFKVKVGYKCQKRFSRRGKMSTEGAETVKVNKKIYTCI